jgi:hypothetical protein
MQPFCVTATAFWVGCCSDQSLWDQMKEIKQLFKAAALAIWARAATGKTFCFLTKIVSSHFSLLCNVELMVAHI